MKKEILKKKNSINSCQLNINKSIKKKIIKLLFLIFFYFKIKKKIKFRNNSNENIGKKIPNISNNLIIKNEIPIYLEKKLKELQITSIEWPLPKKIKFKPYMQDEELKAFLSFMKPNIIYFEFGSGGSTNVASYYNLKVYSVESDALWHNKLKNNSINATYLTVDLKTNKLGYPGNDTTVEDWKKYFQAYQCQYEADIIFIDGRFRVICGLDIFPKIRNDTLVLIHDYNRDIYHILEKYYIKVGNLGNLYAFFKNPNITSIPQNIYNKYMHIKYI